MKKVLSFVALVLSVVLLASTLTLNADSTNRNLNVINTAGYEPETLDPQLATSTASIDITSRMMEGLMRRSGNSIIPGIASRYEVSKDGLTYTFYLRDAVWTDGKPVTAQDFAYGWQRALDPKTMSEYAFTMFYIKNGEKYYRGMADKSQLGIKVINNKTFQVTLEQPTPYFIDLTANMTYMPARKDLVDKYKDKYLSAPEFSVWNGPFRLAEWEHDEYVTVAKNATYWNAKKVKIDEINTYIYLDNQSLMNDYLDGKLDVINLLSEIRSDIPKGESINYFTGAVWYLQFNSNDKNKVLANANIRKALALSINRQEFIKQSSTKQVLPALSLVAPEIIPGKSKSFREEAGNLIKDNDVATAKTALGLGLKQLKLKKLPTIKLTVDDTDTARARAAVLAQMWKKNLGIDITFESIPFAERMRKMRDGSYQMTISGWGPDYYDALTYLEIFDSNSQQNTFGYKNTEFNNLIKSTKKETNRSKRIDLLKKAEKKIIDDYVVAPLYFKYATVVKKPYIKNMPISAAGALYDFTFTELIEGGKILKTEDSKFTMNVNPYWYEDSYDQLQVNGSDLELIDYSGEAAGAVVSTPVDSNQVDLEYIYNLMVSELQGAIGKSSFTDKSNTQISGFPAIKFRLNAEQDNLKVSYSYIIVNTPGKIYQIMLWTETSSFEQRKAEFDKMIQSISIKK